MGKKLAAKQSRDLITVTVVRSAEPLDVDEFLEKYARAIIEVNPPPKPSKRASNKPKKRKTR